MAKFGAVVHPPAGDVLTAAVPMLVTSNQSAAREGLLPLDQGATSEMMRGAESAHGRGDRQGIVDAGVRGAAEGRVVHVDGDAVAGLGGS